MLIWWQNLVDNFRKIGFEPEVRKLASFQDDYGLKFEDEDNEEEDDEDEDEEEYGDIDVDDDYSSD